jgi:hypothetical protein
MVSLAKTKQAVPRLVRGSNGWTGTTTAGIEVAVRLAAFRSG